MTVLAKRRRAIRMGVVGLACVSLAGCGLFDSDDTESGGGSAEQSDQEQVLRTFWVNPDTLDPHIVSNGMWLDQQGLYEGLVVQNADGTDVEPGVAEEWSVSDDGLQWTFQIRDDATWSNGDPVTAEDFAWTYERLLSPGGASSGTTTGANTYTPSLGIANALAFQAGEVSDFGEVGVEAVSENELVFTLEAPNPGFLLGLTHPSMLPLHPDTVEANPQDWSEPENWVSNGPFVLDEWQKNVEITMVPNENYWDQDNVHLDRVEVGFFSSEQPATPVSYDNDEVDVMELSAEQAPTYVDNPDYAEALGTVEARRYTYLAVLRSTNPVMEDVRVRQALSLALGRDIAAGLVTGQSPATSLIPDIIAEGEGFGYVEDVERAQQLLADAGYPDGEGFPELMILTEALRPELEVVVDQWEENLGVSARVNTVERGVYVEERWSVQDTPGFYSGAFISRTNWNDAVRTMLPPRVMEEFSMPADAWGDYQAIQADESLDPAAANEQLDAMRAEFASPEAKEFSAIVADGGSQADPSAADDLFTEAAKVRDELYLYLPVVWLDSFYLVRPGIEGLNLRGAPEAYYLKGVSVSAE